MIKIKVTYNKEELLVFDSIGLLAYLEVEPIYSEEELKKIIYDFIDCDSLEINSVIDCNYKHIIVSKICVNIDELIQKYKYLIEETNCCEIEVGNYCSNCGKKLK